MAYTVRLVVAILGDKPVRHRVQAAIRRAGGLVDHLEATQALDGTNEEILTVRVEDAKTLCTIARAVETVRGVAVREIAELKPAAVQRRGSDNGQHRRK